MPERAIDPRVNPSDETIGTKGLTVRFLLTGDNSNGSIAAFELMVPVAQRLPAPAHSHDHYEESIYGIEGVLTWTVDGKQIDVGPGQALCIPRGARSPVRQQHQPGRESALRDNAGRDRSGVFPRDFRGTQRCSRRSTGPGEDD